MSISSDEISSLIKRRIKEFDVPILAADVGIVTEVGDGIAQIYGLQGAQALELLEFKGGISGMALNLEEDSVGAVILGPYEDIKEGDQVRTTGKIIQVPVGEALVGRVVNALGEPIDGKGPIETKEFAPVEKVAPGVITRQPVDTPLQTGIKAIDAMIPIGRGQRELIIGDRQTGKTAIALDTIINQKGKGVICIYVAIGQRAATVAQVAAVPPGGGAVEDTIAVSPTPNAPAPPRDIAPPSGCAPGGACASCKGISSHRPCPPRPRRVSPSGARGTGQSGCRSGIRPAGLTLFPAIAGASRPSPHRRTCQRNPQAGSAGP